MGSEKKDTKFTTLQQVDYASAYALVNNVEALAFLIDDYPTGTFDHVKDWIKEALQYIQDEGYIEAYDMLHDHVKNELAKHRVFTLRSHGLGFLDALRKVRYMTRRQALPHILHWTARDAVHVKMGVFAPRFTDVYKKCGGNPDACGFVCVSEPESGRYSFIDRDIYETMWHEIDLNASQEQLYNNEVFFCPIDEVCS